MNFSEDQLDGMNTALEEARVHSLDLDPVLRTLRIELEVFSMTESGQVPENRMVSIYLRDVGRLSASLRFYDESYKFAQIEALTLSELEGYIKSLNGFTIYGADFISMAKGLAPAWFSDLSLDLELDSGSNHYAMDLFHMTEQCKLDLRIWFDDLTVFHDSGIEANLGDFIEAGKRWWDAFREKNPLTHGFGLYPREDNDWPGA